MTTESPTFSFGANWQDYLQSISEERIKRAEDDIRHWLGGSSVAGKRILDIGSGSGIHSMCFHRLGASELVSFDVDPNSVAATTSLWQASGRPENWRVREGSVLDTELITELEDPGFDLVYSWGVLHHTGDLWQAMEHAVRLVAPGGRLWIALYVKGPNYGRDLALKQSYNRASAFGKRLIYYRTVVRTCLKLIVFGRPLEIRKLIFAKSVDHRRGMNVYNDIIDWIGGLPYEVASASEVVEFTRERGLVLDKIETGFEGGNHIFLLTRSI